MERRNSSRSTICSSEVTQATTQKKTSLLFVIIVTSWPTTIKLDNGEARRLSKPPIVSD